MFYENYSNVAPVTIFICKVEVKQFCYSENLFQEDFHPVIFTPSQKNSLNKDTPNVDFRNSQTPQKIIFVAFNINLRPEFFVDFRDIKQLRSIPSSYSVIQPD